MDGEGILGLLDTADGWSFVQVLRANVFFLRRPLAGGGTEPTEGAGKMGTTGEDFGKVGSVRRKMGRFYVAVVQAVLLFGL